MQNLKFVSNNLTFIRNSKSKEYFGYKNNIISFSNKLHAIRAQQFIENNYIEFFYTKNNPRHYKLQKIAPASTRTESLMLEDLTKDEMIKEVLNRNLVLRVVSDLHANEEFIILESDLSVNPNVNTKEYVKILSESYNK